MSTLRLLPRTILLLRRPLRPTSIPPAALLTRPSSSSSSSSTSTSAFQQGPSPPRLPADQQAEFERLQRAVVDRIADPTPLPHELQTTPPPSISPASSSRHTTTTTSSSSSSSTPPKQPSPAEDLPTSVRRGARPEFEGDTNPKTGEVGGPKNEPLRWGSGGDWSYNGRVTDF